jgi:hypothetical protein
MYGASGLGLVIAVGISILRFGFLEFGSIGIVRLPRIVRASVGPSGLRGVGDEDAAGLAT